jgi:hypothetical protein
MEARRVGLYLAQCERDMVVATLVERRPEVRTTGVLAYAALALRTRVAASLASGRSWLDAMLGRRRAG